MRRATATTVLCVLILFAGRSHASLHWPNEGEWTPLTIGGGAYNYWDPGAAIDRRIGSSTQQLVGDRTAEGLHAGDRYYAHPGTYDPGDDEMMFRFRLDGSTGNMNAVWQVLFDTDPDDTDLEWVLQLDLSQNPAVVEFAPTQFPSDPLQNTYAHLDILTAAWSTGLVGDFARYSPLRPAGSSLYGSPDYFLDVGMRWADFSGLTGLSVDDSFSVALATSASHSTVNKDYPLDATGTSLVLQYLTDPVHPNSPPEPSTCLLVAVGLAICWRCLLRSGGLSAA